MELAEKIYAGLVIAKGQQTGIGVSQEALEEYAVLALRAAAIYRAEEKRERRKKPEGTI